MRVLIAGAGISGLATAVAFERRGYETTIVEQAPELSEVGAAIGLQPHAVRCLAHLGLRDALKEFNHPQQIRFNNMISGERVNVTELGRRGKELYGAEMATVHRRDLIDALFSNLKNTSVRFNSRITAARQGAGGVTVSVNDGADLSGDILIGCDGLRSTVRRIFFDDVQADFTGFLAWRAVVPAANFRRSFPDVISIWLGAGRHVICYPIRKGRQIYVACYVPAAEIRRERWDVSGDVADLKRSFADSCPELREIIEGIHEAFITGIFCRPPLKHWHDGRVVLMGDAAHPVLPTSGSGAGLALEDAVALAACLGRHGSGYEQAFGEFEERRKLRTSRVLYASRADLAAFQEEDVARSRVRGRLNAGLVRLDPTGYGRMAWLYSHDEVAQSVKDRQELLLEARNPLVRPAARKAFELWRQALKPEDALDGWISERKAYQRFVADLSSGPQGGRMEEVDCDGVPALTITPPSGASGPCIVHLHGGGYALGSPESAVASASRLAQAVDGWALVPRVRLVPEHSAQDQLSDAIKAFRWAAARAHAVFLSGECGGAGLALRLAAALRDSDDRRPLALYLVSPFVDMTLRAPSITANSATEPWMSLHRLLFLAAANTQGLDPEAPELSPINGDLSRLPPAFVGAASGEALADDARAVVQKIVSCGGCASLTLVDDSVHSFLLFDFLPETDAFLRRVTEESSKLLGRVRGG